MFIQYPTLRIDGISFVCIHMTQLKCNIILHFQRFFLAASPYGPQIRLQVRLGEFILLNIWQRESQLSRSIIVIPFTLAWPYQELFPFVPKFLSSEFLTALLLSYLCLILPLASPCLFTCVRYTVWDTMAYLIYTAGDSAFHQKKQKAIHPLQQLDYLDRRAFFGQSQCGPKSRLAVFKLNKF